MKNYINALLSDISYIQFDSNSPIDLNLNLQNALPRNISSVEVDFFNNNFKILDQSENNSSGFSATTFQATRNIYFNGDLKYTKGSIIIANRGTEPSNFGNDFITDGLNLIDSTIAGFLLNISPLDLELLFTKGLIFGKIRDLIGEVLGNDKLFGFNQTKDADVYLNTIYNKYSENNPDFKVSVTGHSLGGHLAFSSAISNPSMVNSSYTYNAAGIDFVSTLLLKFRTTVIERYSENPTMIKNVDDFLNLDNLNNLLKNSFGFFNDVGLQFTTLEGMLRHPENRIAMVTEDMRNRDDESFMALHSVKYLREISIVYEIMSTLLNDKTYSKYPEITSIISNYKIETYARYYNTLVDDKDEGPKYSNGANTLINFILKNIVEYMGINIPAISEYGIRILESISGTTATMKDYTSISATTNDSAKNRANIYALLNIVPFVIYSDTNKLNLEKYNGENYSQEFLNERAIFLDKIMKFSNRTDAYNVFSKNIDIPFISNLLPASTYKNNVVVEIHNGNGKNFYIDLVNKTVIFENTTREEFFVDKNISMIIFLSDIAENFTIDHKNSKIFDSLGNNSIQILNENAEIFLTTGNDTITIDIMSGGSIKALDIIDGGIGDKIIFNATNDSDNVEGTKYDDIIIGLDKDDRLNGGIGNDQIYGDLHMSLISNYAGPIILGNDIINGDDGNDTIYGGTGSDIINGDNGNDLIYGNYSNSGNDVLTDDNILSDKYYTNIINGGQGNDIIYGGEGKDIVNKVDTNDMSYINLTPSELDQLKINSGENTLFGDRITGGKGDDEIYGTQYGDHYYYNSGDGNDTIYERKIGIGINEFIDRIYIKSSFENFSFTHNNTGNLTMTDKLTNQSVVFHDFMNLKYVEKFIFYNNTTEFQRTYEDILKIVLTRTSQNINGIGVVNGNDAMDLSHIETLNGISNITNNINGGYGRDIITGGNLKDTINKSSNNSVLDATKSYGDIITGGKGDDEIYGTNYGDIYNYSLGDGFDKIYETVTGDPTNLNFIDKIVFSSNILATYISFKQLASSVIISYNNLDIIQLVDFINNKAIEQLVFTNGNGLVWDKYDILSRIPEINLEDPTKITGTIFDDVINGTDGDDEIHGGDGNDIINGGKGNDKLYGDNGNDNINGGLGNDEIYGGLGNDTLNGNEGNDIIYGEDGDDTINGGLGADILYGGSGNDKINGGGGGDTIYGGDGNDIINKSENSSNHIILGGKGNDEIYGTFGNDTYHYTSGDGNDTIYETATNETYIDSLYLHQIIPDDVEIYRQGVNANDIFIKIKTKNEYIIIKNYYQDNGTLNYLDQIIFDNGIIWKSDKIIDQAQYYRGTEGSDIINISNKLINIINSDSGNDRITNSIKGTIINSGNGSDIINSSGNDTIIKTENDNDNITVSGNNIIVESGSGYDVINSTMNGSINAGLDNDTIYLGNLKETIIYNIGDGQDTISTNGAGGDVFNITGYNKIDINNIHLSGKGTIVELRFNGNDSLILKNYIILLTNINNSMKFNFDDGSISQNELKDLYTVITKAELADNQFYDTIFSDQITGTDGADNINIINGNGGTGFDIVNSGNGIDTIKNKIDNTVINAGNDDDIIYTYGLNVTVNGDAGNDKIYIDEKSLIGSGYLNGGEGDDLISFQAYTHVSNNYIIEGGLGNDTINMSRGTEKFIFKRDDGNDTINISGSNDTSQKDKLIIKGYLKNDITSDNFSLFDNGRSVILKLSDNDSIKLVNFLSGTLASNNLKYFEFDDGTLTNQELIEKITYIKGTVGNDVIYDTAFNDTIDLSNGGDDQVTLKSGNDTLTTSNNSTMVFVQSSNNIINSGSGSDYLYLDRDSINTLNLKSSNNGHDNIGFAYLNTNGIIHVNINKTINIADTSVKGNYYKFSWGNDSSLSFQPSVLNTRIIFNNQVMNLNDINLVGDDGDNYLSAISSKGQTIYGNGGKDEIYGSIENDIIHGGLDDDKLYGKAGNDLIYGDDGNDLISDTEGNNTIYGGDGNDKIYTGAGNDLIYGGNGDDIINASSGVDEVYGGSGNDLIYGGSNLASKYYGDSGNDTYNIGYGSVFDSEGFNTLTFGSHYTNKIEIRSTSTGFNVFDNDINKIHYNGVVSRIERNSTPPSGYSYTLSLVGNEINRLIELQSALEVETDTSKITSINSEINTLWIYDQP